MVGVAIRLCLSAYAGLPTDPAWGWL